MTSSSEKPVVIVTGASAGIGEGIVRRFASGGFRVVAVARRKDKLEAIAASLKGSGEVIPLALDVTAKDAPERAVDAALKTFGRLDCLINNAGPAGWNVITETDDDMLNAVIDVSLKAAFRFTRAALRVMKPGASIQCVGSVYGLVGGLNGGIYCAVKAGLTGLMQAVTADYGAKGIRANLVAPSVVRTALTEPFWETQGFQRSNQELTPTQRDCTVADVASLCYFLASDEAGYINGQTIALDGGWSATRYVSVNALMAERVPYTKALA